MPSALRTLAYRLLAASMLVAASAGASAAWPERDIRLVVNYGAGGSTDAAARLLARVMETHLDQKIVVENRPGAQGTLALAYVARQAPDGYTIAIVTSSALAIAPHMVPVSYTADNFAFIGQFGQFRFALAVKADAPWQNFNELLAASRQNALFFGVSGASAAIAVFEMNAKYGSRFEQVLYKSGPDALVALSTGQTQASIEPPSEIQPLLDAGRVRLLALASPTRWNTAQNLPTLKELGIDIAVDASIGLAVPAATPEAVRARLAAALHAAVQDSALREGLNALEMDLVWNDGPSYDKALRQALADMRPKMEQAGMPLQPQRKKP